MTAMILTKRSDFNLKKTDKVEQRRKPNQTLKRKKKLKCQWLSVAVGTDWTW